MSLFQSNVVKKYSNSLDRSAIEERWLQFQKIFHNTSKQANIRNSKEEQYQAIFLNDLFVQILGYTQHPNIDYNLITEQKNQTNSKKADGAIILNNNVQAVIELKGTETTDLGKIETQAFGYKNNQKDCNYVIISNFEKLRFYIDNATEFIEFDLFKLTREEFDLLWICLSLESIKNDLPKKIKNESVSNEDKITKELYKDYSAFRRELFSDIERLNPQYDRLLLFKKTQKLLDRFLFIFFAEDRQLLPTNLIFSINLEWQKLRESRVPVSLYDRYIMYFKDLNTGARVTLPAFGKHTNEIVTAQYDIYAYNGGLFQADEVLDSIAINDDLLFKHTKKLSDYDFQSEVDVNILGHIFENSLNEIDEITSTIEGQAIDKAKSKRKKDGVFYTPKYITKYIVDNTIGKLCEEKKIEIALDETKYSTDKKINVTTKKKLKETLDGYRNWLLKLTIVDPASGSGAFLNQALEFLIAEHKYVDELQAKLFGDALVLSDVEGSILENNLFGVDLNEESVEIAKLSLWLRTAQRNRKLNSLNNNIKCGNSLIDDVAIAGDKAFNWESEFPQVFADGGFDVVIGNPPYVPTEYISDIDKNFLEKEYKSAFGRINLYPIFYEKGINILKDNGLLGYITPYTILKNQYYKEARKYILEKSKIIELIDFKGIAVFEDAAVDSIIFIIQKTISKDYQFKQISNIKSFENNKYQKDYFSISEIKKNDDLSMLISLNEKLINRILKKCLQLKQVLNFNQGIITGGNSQYMTYEKSELTKKVLTGSDFNRYSLNYTNQFIKYDTTKLHRPRKKEIFEVEQKIVLRQTSSFPICMLDSEQFYTLDTVHNGLLIDKKYSLKFLLLILNSKLTKFIYQTKINEEGKVFAQVKIIYVDSLPIMKISSSNQQPFIEKADLMLSLNKELQEVSSKFSRYFSGQFKIDKLRGKLEKWYGLSFDEFIKEINKAIKLQKGTLLTKKEEFDWIDLFEENKVKANKLQAEISATDKAIDGMVYELYGLSEVEIGIVEGS